MPACCEEILNEKRSLSRQTAELDFLQSSDNRALSPVLLDTEDEPR